jgi:hypothetical protein
MVSQRTDMMALDRWWYTAMGLLVWILLPTVGLTQDRLDTCAQLRWDYEPDPLLGFFRIYVSRTSGVYPIHPTTPALSRPTVVVPAIPTMVTEVICTRVQAVVRAPGTYYLVMTAASRNMAIESEPSNELTFTVGVTTVARPSPLPPMGGQ